MITAMIVNGIVIPNTSNAGPRSPRRPKTSSSTSEFDPRRLAPFKLTQAHSPAAKRPGRGVAAAVLVEMPPIM